MEYEFEPAKISRRSGRSALVAAVAFATVLGLIVGIGAIGRADSRAAPRSPLAVEAPGGSMVPGGSTELGGSTEPGVGASPGVPDAPAPHQSVAPPTIRCHDMPDHRCVLVAEAAVRAAADPTLPPATSVEVWPSLVCGPSLDCPPSRLDGRRAAGSATVRLLGSRLVLLVNINEIVGGAAPGSPNLALDAWVIRSQR